MNHMEKPFGLNDKRSLCDRILPHLTEVRARAPEVERERAPIQPNMDLIKRVGLVRAVVPSQFGGLESDFCDWMQALRLLASADMSAAWIAGLAGAHSFVLTKFDAQVQTEIWGTLGPDALISSASALMEDGVTKPVAGGVRVSGRWRFSSGVTVADWTMLLVKVKQPGTEDFQYFWALLPKSDYSVDDTWHTAGMRGTGSNDVVVSDAFIPSYRLGGPGALTVNEAGKINYDNPLFDVPFRVMFPILFAPVLIGGAEGALELYRQLLLKRKMAMTGIPLIESPLSHVRLAEAVVRLRGVAALLESNWHTLASRIRSAELITEDDQLNWRVDQAFAGREAVRTVEQLIETSGAAIFFESHPLQRFWRDLHVAGGHTRFSTDLPMQILGRQLLGLPLDPRWAS